MFILRKKIFNKIPSRSKQLESYKRDIELLAEENAKLKESYESILITEKKLKSQNEHLSNLNNKFKQENERLNKLNSFINFQEFLANSYTSPIVNAPFYPQDKRVFAFMDHISKYLINKTTKIKE